MSEQTIRRNYERGLWTAQMVRLAVRKGIITQVECDAILMQEATDA